MRHYTTLMFGLGETVQSKWALGFALVMTACASESLDPGTLSASGGASSGNGGTMCSAALRQALSLVERASLAQVRVLSASDGEMLIYVDATTGGIARQQTEPWVYLSLATGARIELTDFEALESKSWDLALKRAAVRTNSGDSGPGLGGLGVQSSWAGLATHTLAPAPGVVYAVRGGEGKLYKLQFLDYYSNADGTTGARDGGNYKLRVAPLG